MRKLLFFILLSTTALSVFAQNLDADDPDGDAVNNRTVATNPDFEKNLYDLDKDNDGIINSLENCNYAGLIEYDEVQVSSFVSDLFIRVEGVEIGKITVTIIPDPGLGGTFLNRIQNPTFTPASALPTTNFPQQNVSGLRWYFGNGVHDGSSIRFDVELYPDYLYFADDIRLYLFGGFVETSDAPAQNIDDFNIISTVGYEFFDPGNEIALVDGANASQSINNTTGSAVVTANTVEEFFVIPNSLGRVDEVDWYLRTDDFGDANDGNTKNVSLTYQYTLGSNQTEGLGLAVYLGNTNCSSILADTDGVPNQVDLDSDNDGCPDAYEFSNPNARVSFTNERLLGGNGTNGLNNALETNDTGDSTLGYTFNAADFDSNNNLVPDHLEASVQGPNCFKTTAGTALTGNATIGNMGISTVPNTANQNYFANGTTNALDVVSKTKGIGLPLVSNANLPLTATAGTVLWNTDENCLMLWHADNGSGSAGWACVQRAGDGL